VLPSEFVDLAATIANAYDFKRKTRMTTDPDTVPQSEHFLIAVDPSDVVRAYAAHRRRFALSVATLNEHALRSPSRCSEWSVADILRHGCDVDRWMRTIWNGDLPFTAFDPRVTPHAEVLHSRSLSDLVVRDRYVASSVEMAADVGSAGPERWGLPSLSYVGAMPWWQTVLHVLWDSWLHERDGLLPRGMPVDEVEEEVTAVLSYLLALAVHISRRLGRNEPLDAVVCGLRVSAGDGPVRVSPVVELPAGVPTLSGYAPAVIDVVSGRGNLDDVLSGDDEVLDRLRLFTGYISAAA